MNRTIALRISSLIGVLALMSVHHAMAGAPEGQMPQADTEATYHGYTPAVRGMVVALKGGQLCHQAGHCSDWVASVIEAFNAAPYQDSSSWGARMSERIAQALRAPATSLGATIEQIACSEHACFAEASYAKGGLPVREMAVIANQLRDVVSASAWAQSELRVKPDLHGGFDGLVYEGPATNPTVDVIWVWPRK